MIPIAYSLRTLFSRKVPTSFTVLGIALVVFVFAAEMMLTSGLKKTLVATGADDNVVVIRKASQTELTSIVPRDQADIIKAEPEIAKASDGSPLITSEIYVLINLGKRVGNGSGNVVVRGVSPKSMELRPQVKLVAGRLWQPGFV